MKYITQEQLNQRISGVGGWKAITDMIECQIGRKLMGKPDDQLVLNAVEILEALQTYNQRG
jgi:hypothetical protein